VEGHQLNIIIFSSDAKGAVSGHWYGYVVPADVPVLLYKHVGKENVLSVMLVMPKRILSCMVPNELCLGNYVSIFASDGMSLLWASWVQGDNHHQPWPPPEELRMTTYDAKL
jgi:hypothetical protein